MALNAAGFERFAAAAMETGLSGRDAVVATAIAAAESGLDNSAVGGPNSNGTRDWGGWQINDVHKGSGFDPAQGVRDLAYNAKWMHRISNGGKDWTPWSAYNNGRYARFLPNAVAAVTSLGAQLPAGEIVDNVTDAVGDAAKDAASAVTSPLEAIGGFVGALSDPHTWQRVGLIAGGTLAVVLAFVAIGKDTIVKGITP